MSDVFSSSDSSNDYDSDTSSLKTSYNDSFGLNGGDEIIGTRMADLLTKNVQADQNTPKRDSKSNLHKRSHSSPVAPIDRPYEGLSAQREICSPIPRKFSEDH